MYCNKLIGKVYLTKKQKILNYILKNNFAGRKGGFFLVEAAILVESDSLIMNNTSDEGSVLFGVDNILYEIYLQNTVFHGNFAMDSLISIENTLNIYFINITFVMNENLLFSITSSQIYLLSSFINDVKCSNLIPACFAFIKNNPLFIIKNTFISNVNHVRAEGGIFTKNSYLMILNSSLINMKTFKQIGSCLSGIASKLDILSLFVSNYDANCIFLEKSSLFLSGSYFNNLQQSSTHDSISMHGTILCNDCISLVLSFTVFEYNHDLENGGVLTLLNFNLEAQNQLISCVFQGNKAKNKGGALFLYDTTLEIHNCLFFENEASEGGAIFYQG